MIKRMNVGLQTAALYPIQSKNDSVLTVCGDCLRMICKSKKVSYTLKRDLGVQHFFNTFV